MASSCIGRKCMQSVSLVGPTTPRPPSPGAKWSVATVLVVLFAVLALAAMMVAVFVLRRKRIQPERLEAAGKPAQGVEQEGKSSTGPRTVELVVMAGESKPTYLATPTIQCPPLMIQAKPENQ